jgi:aryl-alcohol dehydrogenase-like predicted oxidoreductase
LELRKFGRADLEVPVVGLGTWTVFDVAPEAEEGPRAVVEAAFEAGMRLVDTSPMYGRAEAVLGRTLQASGVRASAVVATKIWTPSLLEGRRQFEAQLSAFGGRVEIEQIHNLVAWRDHIVWLEEEVKEGCVALIGATHWNESMFGELIEIMGTGHVDCIQIPYNPLEGSAARDVLPLAEEMGIGVIAMRPFAEGALVRRGPKDPGVLRDLGVQTWAQALLKWTLSDRRVHVAIPATSSVEHTRSNATAGEPPWFDEEQRRLVEGLAAT